VKTSSAVWPVTQLGDINALVTLSGPARAVISFGVVLLIGGLIANWRPAAVNRAVARTVDDSPVAIVYGLAAFGLAVFFGGYLLTQVTQLGSEVVTLAGLVVVVTAVVVLASYGYLVVGSYLTEIEGRRRIWHGVVIGATLSAIPWVILSATFGLAVWVLLAAVGLGSPTRHWFHGARTVESEAQQ
jgi:hypothetical protein